MMACADENLNAQEQSFLAALGSVAGFEIAEDGALVLRSAEGSVIVARR
jgi:heat shock protein HslJ